MTDQSDFPDNVTIRRAPRDKANPYMMTLRANAQNSALSFAARGMLWYLLSQADDWQINFEDLKREGNLGRDATRALMGELKASGHLHKQVLQDGAGKLCGWEWLLYENPFDTDYRMTEKPSDGPTVLRPDRRTGQPNDGQTTSIQNKSLFQRDSIGPSGTPEEPECIHGFPIHSTVWWTEEDSEAQTRIDHEVTVIRETAKMVEVQFPDGTKKLRRPTSLSATKPEYDSAFDFASASPHERLVQMVGHVSWDAPLNRKLLAETATRVKQIVGAFYRQWPERQKSDFTPELIRFAVGQYQTDPATRGRAVPREPGTFVSDVGKHFPAYWAMQRARLAPPLPLQQTVEDEAAAAARRRAAMPKPVVFTR